jgi:hypothetical protein
MREEASILPAPFALRVNHGPARRRGARVVRGLDGTGESGSALIEFGATIDHEADPGNRFTVELPIPAAPLAVEAQITKPATDAC